MASEESFMINNSSSITNLEYEDDDTDDGSFHYQTRQSSLSRLSICTSSFHDEDSFTDHPAELAHFISELSLDSFNDDVGAEADGEISDNDDGEDSDSDKESLSFYSLPTIISRRRRKLTVSEKLDSSKCNLLKQGRVLREKNKRESKWGHGFNGVERDSDGDGNRYGGGGKKSMTLGFGRDLGFDLEVPSRVSVSAGSTRETQTSSGGDSPIANWRISSPGDDPKEVKARLKMWAQAVALASASR